MQAPDLYFCDLHSAYNCPEEIIVADAIIAGIIQNILK